MRDRLARGYNPAPAQVQRALDVQAVLRAAEYDLVVAARLARSDARAQDRAVVADPGAGADNDVPITIWSLPEGDGSVAP